jgi:alanine dehydrogenase
LKRHQDSPVCRVNLCHHAKSFVKTRFLSKELPQGCPAVTLFSKQFRPDRRIMRNMFFRGGCTMKIGCPKEIKPQEYRVGITPSAAREAVSHGHAVMIETNAGVGAGFTDADYTAAGAKIIGTAAEVFAASDMIVKVKEPQAVERRMLREGQVLFTYLHLAPDPDQTRDLLESGVTAIAYETVTDDRGGLPLLAPMSEVAGRLAPQVGAWTLQKANGGRGVLLGGVPGVAPGKVVVLGGGVVGTHAAKVAAGMGADVTVLDKSLPRLRYLDDVFGHAFTAVYSTGGAIADLIREADMVIGAVLIPGAAAPKLIRREQLATMKPGAVLVDVAIDQGGCFETSRPTTHQDPIYEVDGVMHYCVANMPGAVARTSTLALGNATLPFMLALADKGWKRACAEDPHLLAGLNVHAGHLTYGAVGTALGLEVMEPSLALAA